MYHNNCMNKYISKLLVRNFGKVSVRGKIPEAFPPSDEMDLSHVDKHESSQQINTNI